MDLDIRQAVKNNLHDSKYEEIYETIQEAANSNEEAILPGLGVMFEVLWNTSTNEEKELIAKKITTKITQ